MENKAVLSNPYKPIGSFHNNGLDFIVSKLNSQDYSIENVIDLSSQFMQAFESISLNASTINTSNAIYTKYYDFCASAINAYQQVPLCEFLRDAKISKEAIFFINEILDVSKDLDYPTTLTILENIEQNILFSDMKISEKSYPLLCVAVAKASVSYWITQLNNPNSPWIPFIPGGIDKFKWPWSADANGAIQGAVTGAATGAVTGGVVGGIVGALGGAILGGLGASVAQVLFPQ